MRLHVVSQDACSNAYGDYGGISARMLCASDVGKDSCQGDSGGPLVSTAGKQVRQSVLCVIQSPTQTFLFKPMPLLRCLCSLLLDF